MAGDIDLETWVLTSRECLDELQFHLDVFAGAISVIERLFNEAAPQSDPGRDGALHESVKSMVHRRRFLLEKIIGIARAAVVVVPLNEDGTAGPRDHGRHAEVILGMIVSAISPGATVEGVRAQLAAMQAGGGNTCQ